MALDRTNGECRFYLDGEALGVKSAMGTSLEFTTQEWTAFGVKQLKAEGKQIYIIAYQNSVACKNGEDGQTVHMFCRKMMHFKYIPIEIRPLMPPEMYI